MSLLPEDVKNRGTMTVLAFLFSMLYFTFLKHIEVADLCVPSALMTVDRSLPSLAVTCVTYCVLRMSDSSTVLDSAALPVQSHSEPGRWQHSPVVMALRGGSGVPSRDRLHWSGRSCHSKHEQSESPPLVQ